MTTPALRVTPQVLEESRTMESLALPLLAATQAAASACAPFVGRGDRKAADRAAVDAMRQALARVPGRGCVVIGEGEKDHAPMLFAGEEVGDGGGDLRFDLAVDPLEGTNFCARSLEGAISVLAAAPSGALWTAPSFYMEKLVVGPAARGVIEIDAPAGENLKRIAAALGKRPSDTVIAILDKPRHRGLIAEVRSAGARVMELPDGDVMGSLRALIPAAGVDACLGIGGAPEGVITACAVRLLGGDMQGRLAPQSDEERARLAEYGAEIGEILNCDDLVRSSDCLFAATGVTGGTFFRPAERAPWGWRTRSLLVTTAGAMVAETVAAPEPVAASDQARGCAHEQKGARE